MANEPEDGWILSIYVPDVGDAAEPLPDDPAVQKHALSDYLPSFGRVEKVPARSVEAQWGETLNTLMKLTTAATEKSDTWVIDEIEAGLTLSAKGELLFIAEAGAEASIKFTLKRRTNQNPPTK